MPIISRTLTKLADREDLGVGIKTWRIDGLDAIGERWVYGPFNATQAEAEVLRDTVVWDLAGRDRNAVLEFVQQGAPNTVAAFDYTNRDIVEDDGEDFVYLTFATSGRDMALRLAWWLDTLTTGARNTIGGRVGADGAARGRIDQRYPPMVLVLPWLDAVEDL
jgi:hypothetical protein